VEKVNEHCFLFGVEGGADFQRLPIRAGGVEGYKLDVLHGLKIASVALGVMDLLSETVEVCSLGYRLQDGLSVLDALHVALVGVLVGGPDGDDTLRPRILSLR
jgi:hypothetical protein